MCVAGQQGGAQPVSLNQHRSELRRQEGNPAADTFSQDIRTAGVNNPNQRSTGSSGFGPVRKLGERGPGALIDAMRGRLAENARIESGLRAGTLGGSGSSSLAPPTAQPRAKEDASLAKARQKRGSTFLA